MLQIVEQTKEEKMVMYMKLPKKQIAEMLINCNDVITALTQSKNCVIPAVSNLLCVPFEPDNSISSTTKCECGREKWEHPKST